MSAAVPVPPDSIPVLRRGRPRAPRRVLDPAFLEAIQQLTKQRLLELVGMPGRDISAMRCGREFPVTPRVFDRLRGVAALVGHAGSLLDPAQAPLRFVVRDNLMQRDLYTEGGPWTWCGDRRRRG